eukprot:scaffold116168_cov15-Phaeocystis_antarctica.AAC.1
MQEDAGPNPSPSNSTPSTSTPTHVQEEAGGVARAVQQGECLDAIEEAQVRLALVRGRGRANAWTRSRRP